MTPLLLSFVIPVRNDAARLRRCLESIRQAEAPGPIEIIVADNGSSDGSADVARELGAVTLDLPNRRVSEVRNAAAREARADLLAFVDADHTLAPGWIGAALASMADPSVVAAGADYHAPADGTWVQAIYDRLRTRAPEARSAEWLPSGNLVVRKAVFERIGGFDTSLESCEDVDLCRRLRESGGRLIATDAMRSVHHGDPRSLRALFMAELWRGRDNLRVSLRERLTPRSAIGLGLTILHLIALAVVVLGLLAVPVGGLVIAAAGLSVIGLLILLRAARLLRHGDVRPRLIPQALAVAAVYDSARALALVARAGHDLRRRSDR